MLVTVVDDMTPFNATCRTKRRAKCSINAGHRPLEAIVHIRARTLSPDHGEVQALYVALMRNRRAWSQARRYAEAPKSAYCA